MMKLYRNTCSVCEDNKETTYPTLDSNKICSRCNSSISQRILKKNINYMSINTEGFSILSDKSDISLPDNLTEISKDIRDPSVYQNKYNLILLNQNNNNLESGIELLDKLPELVLPQGIVIVSLIDISEDTIMSHKALENISSDSLRFDGYHMVNFAETECSTLKVEVIDIISQNEVNIDSIFNIKE